MVVEVKKKNEIFGSIKFECENETLVDVHPLSVAQIMTEVLEAFNAHLIRFDDLLNLFVNDFNFFWIALAQFLDDVFQLVRECVIEWQTYHFPNRASNSLSLIFA